MTDHSVGLVEYGELFVTRKQLETIEMLHSRVDKLEVARDETIFATELVFTGDGQDGPCIGYIKSDGTVDWMVEA